MGERVVEQGVLGRGHRLGAEVLDAVGQRRQVFQTYQPGFCCLLDSRQHPGHGAAATQPGGLGRIDAQLTARPRRHAGGALVLMRPGLDQLPHSRHPHRVQHVTPELRGPQHVGGRRQRLHDRGHLPQDLRDLGAVQGSRGRGLG